MSEFRHYCPNCERPIYCGMATGESGIYQSHGVSDLCEPCFFEEMDLEEEVGTNNNPARLAHYREVDARLNHK